MIFTENMASVFVMLKIILKLFNFEIRFLLTNYQSLSYLTTTTSSIVWTLTDFMETWYLLGRREHSIGKELQISLV